MKRSRLAIFVSEIMVYLYMILVTYLVVDWSMRGYMRRSEFSKEFPIFFPFLFALISVLYLFLGILFFNHVVRRFAWFKPYFMSRYNFLSAKFRHIQEFDFSKEILFEKLLEVLIAAGFEIRQSNKSTGTIFAFTYIDWWTCGENIYISLTEVNGKTTLDFCSVSVSSFFSWGRNKRHYKKILQEFEESLII